MASSTADINPYKKLFDDIEALRKAYQGEGSPVRDENVAGQEIVQAKNPNDDLDKQITSLSNYLYYLKSKKEVPLFEQSGVEPSHLGLKDKKLTDEFEKLKSQAQKEIEKLKRLAQIQKIENWQQELREHINEYKQVVYLGNTHISDDMKTKIDNLLNDLIALEEALKNPDTKTVSIYGADSAKKDYSLEDADKALITQMDSMRKELQSNIDKVKSRIEEVRAVEEPQEGEEIKIEHVAKLSFDLRSQKQLLEKHLPDGSATFSELNKRIQTLGIAVRDKQKQVTFEGQAAVDIKVAYASLSQQVAELTQQMKDVSSRPKAPTQEDFQRLNALLPKEDHRLVADTEVKKELLTNFLKSLQTYSDEIQRTLSEAQEFKKIISSETYGASSIEKREIEELGKSMDENIRALQTLQQGLVHITTKVKPENNPEVYNDPEDYRQYLQLYETIFEKQLSVSTYLMTNIDEKLSKIDPQYQLKSKLNAEARALQTEDKALIKSLAKKPKKNLEDFLHIIEYLENQARIASLTQVPHIDFLRDCQDKCESLYLELAAFRDSKQGKLNKVEELMISERLELLGNLYAYAFNPVIHDDISKKKVYHFTDTSEVFADLAQAKAKQRDEWAKGKYKAPTSKAGIKASARGSETKENAYLSHDHTHERLKEGQAEFSTITATEKGSDTKAYFSSISTIKDGVRETVLAAFLPEELSRVRSLLHPLSSIPSDIATKWAVAMIGTEIQGGTNASLNIELTGDYRGVYGKHAEQFLEAAFLYAAYLQKYENKKIYLFNYSGVPSPHISPNDPRIDVLASRMAKNPEIFGLQSEITASLHGKTIKQHEEKYIAAEVGDFKKGIKLPEQYRSKARPEGESTPTPAEKRKPADSATPAKSTLTEMATTPAATLPEASKGTFAVMPETPPATTPAAKNSLPPIAPPPPTMPAAKQSVAPAAKKSTPPIMPATTPAQAKPVTTPAKKSSSLEEAPTEMQEIPRDTTTRPRGLS